MKTRRSKTSLFLILLLLSVSFSSIRAQEQAGEVIAIVGGTVVDGTGAQPFKATVLIRGERIAAVGPNVEIPSDARVIRADGQTIIPGLFDLHTHLPYSAVNGLDADWGKNLKAYLYCGVTSVVDFGTYPETYEPMRRLTRRGAVLSPRLTLAARITTPGGHGAEGGRGDFFSLEVLTPREGRAAIRRVLPYKPDVIKVFTDGWRYGAAPDMTSMTEETLAAIVDEAHKNGLEVLTHTVTLEKAKIAARAGVDVIAHGVGNADVDDELIQLMKSKGTSYVSTLAVYENRARGFMAPLLETTLEPAAKEIIKAQAIASDETQLRPAREGESPQARRWRYLMRNIEALRKAGISFGVGTDAGVTGTYHGWATLREMQLLVAGGLTPLEAITAATGNAARALKVDSERGTITPGKLADLVLIAGEPHKNIADIERTSRVFLGGREIDREKLARDIQSSEQTPITAIKAKEKIDDFESATGRSSIDTLWVNSTDSGHDNSKMVWGRTLRDRANHALTVMSRFSEKDRPVARVSLPLSRGAVEPVDASAFRGVEFDARGDGDYLLVVPTAGVRDSAYYRAPFKAEAKWRRVRIDFASLKQESPKKPVAWTGADVLMLTFEVARGAGQIGWLEIDNLRFFK